MHKKITSFPMTLHIRTPYIFYFVEIETPYNITVKALNLAGCGEEQQIYCFTQEGGSYSY